ncbi:hypothetical protein ACR564_004335, partial [Vibrio vulnificus]
CGDFCGENGLRKVGLCGIHPLTQRYAQSRKINGLWFSLFPLLFSLVFFGKSAFLSAVFRTLILWR